eukprot:TRINITY_DN2463_c0_g1_i4.p1 TRINITY_DN2463_c0_g1~~TRINITY_DN2463_c0_g1_i4.p1  ORF type:complete len:490 (+),score=199.21 TRINITY_DN2463_c0_g1_i4:365-1834(+)
MKKRDILRKMHGHQAAVHVTKWAPSNLQIMSTSDDCTMRGWDLTSGKEILKVAAHEDYIRCGTISSGSQDVWITGSYDHTVKLWDTRLNNGSGSGGSSLLSSSLVKMSSKNVMEFDHGAPVHAVLCFPSGTMVATAGGPMVKIWDVLNGRLLHKIAVHQKDVTAIALDGSHSRLLSASLDRQVKVVDLQTQVVTHSFSFDASITAMGISPDNQNLVVGTSSGIVTVRERKVEVQETVNKLAKAHPVLVGSYRYFVRGQSSKAVDTDFRIKVTKKAKLKHYDRFLKQFQYAEALDAAVKTNRSVVIVSVIEELIRRDGLRIALSGRDETALEPLMVFLLKHVNNPRYSSLLIDVCNMVFDIYSGVLGQSMVIDDLFTKLQTKLKHELRIQRELQELNGMLDMLMAASSNNDVKLSALSVEDELVKSQGKQGEEEERETEEPQMETEQEEQEQEQEEEQEGEKEKKQKEKKSAKKKKKAKRKRKQVEEEEE